MAELLHTGKRVNPLAVWAITVLVAGFLFLGASLYLRAHGQAKTPPPAATTHSTPVGGAVQDGVFRSTPEAPELDITLWRI